jgi:hypothetical protein
MIIIEKSLKIMRYKWTSIGRYPLAIRQLKDLRINYSKVAPCIL